MSRKAVRQGIAHWPASERPRERLWRRAPNLDGCATPRDSPARRSAAISAVQVSMEVLDRLGGSQVGPLRHRGTLRRRGVGEAKAAQVKPRWNWANGRWRLRYRRDKNFLEPRAVRALSSCAAEPPPRDFQSGPVGRQACDSWRCHGIRRQLDAQHRASAGGVHDGGEGISCRVIFLHNHPSGDPTPSQEDHVLTARLVSAGDVLGIRVLDHLVVGDGRYVSFADEGWLTQHA